MPWTSSLIDGRSQAGPSIDGPVRFAQFCAALMFVVGAGMIALAAGSPASASAPLAYPVGAFYLVIAGLAWRAGRQHLPAWAWTAWMLSVVGFITGILTAGLVGDLLDLDLWSAADLTGRQAIAATVVFWAFSLVPAIVGVLLGVRVARTAGTIGLAAAIANSVTLTISGVLLISDLASLPP
jgi:hypothetical protein